MNMRLQFLSSVITSIALLATANERAASHGLGISLSSGYA